MQISVIKPDEDNIQKLKDVISYVYQVYGVQTIEAYIIKDDGEIGFVFYGDDMNMYISNKESGLEFKAFHLDEEGKLKYYGVGDYRIFFNGDTMDVLDRDNKQMSLYVTRLSEGLEDATSFNSYLNFWQYDSNSDVSCSIQYAQKLKLDGNKETNVYTNEVENVFIDPRYSVKGGITKGLVANGKKYYSRVTCTAIDISDFETEESSKYLPIRYISQGNRYYTLGSLSAKYDYSEIADVIKSYGFRSDIPGLLLDIYRETDSDFRKLLWIIREVESERIKKENDKGMVFKIDLNDTDKN